MIAAIPAEDRPSVVISGPIPVSRLFDLPPVKLIPAPGFPRTCLSCGAKTNTAGELPCGH